MQVSNLISDAFSTKVCLKPSQHQKHVGVSFGNVGWTLCSCTYRNVLASCESTNGKQIRNVRGERLEENRLCLGISLCAGNIEEWSQSKSG